MRTRVSSLLVFGVVLFLAAGPCVGAAETAVTPKLNRLAQEKSPYLRQHASNPVDWYPWGDEAFEKARRENKPIFLSIGYSTCHWCHVMARESFSDPETAALLNAHFVAIKVDREERPDIDRVYMMFVQASTGEGGWPLSVWLTPDLKPFIGGTYFPRESAPGQPGFKAVLSRIAEMWAQQRDELVARSNEMLSTLAADSRSAAAGALPTAALRTRALEQLRAVFDADNGGFESAPKYPQPSVLEFLLDVQATSPEAAERAQAREMMVPTLHAIASGGLHDVVGGGFHRYAVDPQWRVPHFEKMLYDQAQLASVYLSAWQLTGESSFADTARDTLDYVRRDLADPAGGFYSAEDADSRSAASTEEHREGAFYVWTATEIEHVLGADAAVFGFACGVTAEGNAPPEFAGRNILYRAHSAAECAAKFGLSEDAAHALVEDGRKRLREARDQRPRPARDDKVITAWNGLMISACARGAQVLGDPAYSAAAAKAAAFLRTALYDEKTGRLAHSWRAGASDQRAFAEDYAFLIQGLLDLYETTFDLPWLQWAARLQEKQNELFLDPRDGGFFANTADDASIVLRLKAQDDGAEPSANSVSVRNLARLAAMLHRDDWRGLAGRTAGAFAPLLDRAPTALPQLLAASGWLEGSPRQILIHGDANAADTARLVTEVWRRFLPRHVLLRIDSASRAFFATQLPVVADLPDEGGAATAYVCENFTCKLPTGDTVVLAKILDGAK